MMTFSPRERLDGVPLDMIPPPMCVSALDSASFSGYIFRTSSLDNE